MREESMNDEMISTEQICSQEGNQDQQEATGRCQEDSSTEGETESFVVEGEPW